MRPTIVCGREAVSSGHYLASVAGLEVLAAGGNAVDAGVAAGLVLGVVESDYVSFGGVAPIIIRMADTGRTLTLSGVGPWPLAASCEALRARFGDDIPPGVSRIVVPAAPSAWLTALARFGTMSFGEVAAAAIHHADKGFPVYPLFRATLAEAESAIAGMSSSAPLFLPGGRLPAIGSLFLQTELAATLRFLADEEAAARDRAIGLQRAHDAFYKGDVAATIAAYVQSEGGLLARDDLAAFSVDVEDAVRVRFQGTDVYGCGAWCQGPMLLEALKIVDAAGLDGLGHNSVPYLHLLAEAIRLAARDRERYFGDPRFVEVPLARLLSDAHAARAARRIDPASALPAFAPGEACATTGAAALDLDTSFVSVVDRFGNAFAATPSDGCTTAPIVPGLGFVASPRGNQSWTDPEHPSSIRPGKRPRLTPNPAIAVREEEFVMPFGTPGHDTQTQVLLQVLLNLLHFGMSPQQAVEAPRIASLDFPSSATPHAVRPGLLFVEEEIGGEAIGDLRRRGHDARAWPQSGADYFENLSAACLVRRDLRQGTVSAAADHRRPAYAIGR